MGIHCCYSLDHQPCWPVPPSGTFPVAPRHLAYIWIGMKKLCILRSDNAWKLPRAEFPSGINVELVLLPKLNGTMSPIIWLWYSFPKVGKRQEKAGSILTNTRELRWHTVPLGATRVYNYSKLARLPSNLVGLNRRLVHQQFTNSGDFNGNWLEGATWFSRPTEDAYDLN